MSRESALLARTSGIEEEIAGAKSITYRQMECLYELGFLNRIGSKMEWYLSWESREILVYSSERNIPLDSAIRNNLTFERPPELLDSALPDTILNDYPEEMKDELNLMAVIMFYEKNKENYLDLVEYSWIF